MLNVLKKNKNLISFNVLNVLIDSLRGFVFLILISLYFGLEKTGIYVLSTRILSIPLNLISISLGKVFFQSISKKKSFLKNITNNYFLGLLLILIPMTLFVVFSLNPLFDYIIDKSYIESKQIVFSLMPWILFTFLSHPFSFTLTVTNNEKSSFLFSLLYSIFSLSIIYLNKNDFISFIDNLSIIMSLFLLTYIIMNLIYINGYLKKNS